MFAHDGESEEFEVKKKLNYMLIIKMVTKKFISTFQ